MLYGSDNIVTGADIMKSCGSIPNALQFKKL